MSEYNYAYIGMATAFLFVAVGAMGFGLWGMYTIATGGTSEAPADELGTESFECSGEEFAGEPAFPGEPAHETDRTILSTTEGESVNATVSGGTYRFEISMKGTVLDAWAAYEDGAELSVEVVDSRVVVETQSDEPYRLWIDNAADRVTRTELTICPASF